MPVLYQYSDSTFFFYHNLSDNPIEEQAYKLHVHNRYEMIYIISGEGEFIAESSHYRIYPGCLIISRANEAHCLKIDAHKAYERFMIQFPPSVLSAIVPDSSLSVPFERRNPGERNIFYKDDFRNFRPAEIFQAMCIPQINDAKRLEAIKIYFPCLLLQLYELFGDNTDAQIQTATSFRNMMLQYVNNHIFDGITVDDLKNKFYISAAQINRLFKYSTGYPAHHYIRMKRLLTAREMILTGSTAEAASQRCGWKDYSSFYRAFKQYFGVSPKQDRKNSWM